MPSHGSREFHGVGFAGARVLRAEGGSKASAVRGAGYAVRVWRRAYGENRVGLDVAAAKGAHRTAAGCPTAVRVRKRDGRRTGACFRGSHPNRKRIRPPTGPSWRLLTAERLSPKFAAGSRPSGRGSRRCRPLRWKRQAPRRLASAGSPRRFRLP